MQNSYVEKLWGKIFGVLDSPRIQKAYSAARISTKEWIRYNELERILVSGFIERGSLEDLSEELMESVDCTRDELFRTASQDYDRANVKGSIGKNVMNGFFHRKEYTKYLI